MRRLFLLLLLASVPIFAQTTSAILTGRASAGGAPLAGVTVTVSSPQLQGTRSTTTGPGGEYTFPALPPGPYEVAFELGGMQKAVLRVDVPLSETVRVDAELRPAIAEAVTVIAAPASVLETPQVSTNFEQSFIDILPVGRAIQDVVRLAPGVQATGPNNQLLINGAPSSENLWLVNGVTITEQTRNQPQNLFIEDAIQETTVMTAGISAEYGRFTGGVVNVLTKSGGNELSGSLRDSLSNDKWTARTRFPGETEHLDHINDDYEGTVGGRIIRDRLWFFVAGRYADRRERLALFDVGTPYTHTSKETRYETKLTGNIAHNHTLVGSYLNVVAKDDNQPRGRSSDFRTLQNPTLPNSLTALHYTGVLGQRLVLEGQFSRKFFEFRDFGGFNRDRIQGTRVADVLTGDAAWAPQFCAVCGRTNRNNREEAVKASWFSSTARLGTHNVVAGLDDFHELAHDANNQTASDYTILGTFKVVNNQLFLQMTPGESFIQYEPLPTVSHGSDFAARAVFVNDRIDWGTHISFNAGLRYDQNRGHDQLEQEVARDSRLSPRLGAIYDLRGDGRDRVSVTYSDYAARIDPTVATTTSGGTLPAFFYFDYEGPAINAGSTNLVPTDEVLRRVFAWFDSVGGPANTDFLLASLFATGDVFQGELKSPVMREMAAGYGHQFGASGYVRADYVHRRWHDFYTRRVTLATGRLTDAFGNVVDRKIIENSDTGLRREYDGVMLQGNWRRGRFTAGGNYTWSRLWGNVEQELAGQAAIPQPQPGAYYPEFNDFPQFQPTGYLAADVRNRANLWTAYDVPLGAGRFDVSLYESYHSGRDYSANGTVSVRALPNPGYVERQNVAPYFFSKRGAFRLSGVRATSLGLNYLLPVARVQLFAEADVINVFNAQGIESPTASSIQLRVNTNSRDRNLAVFNPKTTTPIECPRGVATSSAQCKGIANYQLASDFGQVIAKTAYQQPRTFRISLGVRF